ncbi:5-methyltetrahydrofolate:homocysteine methyltransferase, putative [Ixodes scapularis]|uniref:5-methyltetrahydrofolate:homocysteine methyltransferase, putative n=1 Tax=Ixodes scapularis TaxID=6945 RepID=B7Q2S9_IXOSC|nr:5-methyltetrahydrofolate:homocysteine methyltransferase, putative [Ixodes scapularis]|eukprot:XP_002410979.1 5-methyltetrahydrofolate:homocysteine methyltransferase, putative [Ixodes scapularis]
MQPTSAFAGSVGSYGAYPYDGSEYTGSYADTMSVKELCDWHRFRVQHLVRLGCDLLAFETIPALQEALALLQLLREHPGTKGWLSFGCQDEKLTAKGECLQKAIQAVLGKDSGSQICAIRVNCCRPDMVGLLLKDARKEGQPPLVAYADAEVASWTLVPKDSDQLGNYVAEWYRAGVRPSQAMNI